MGIRRHLTYANVTATLALVLALGAGGAYAVDLIGSREIRDNSVLSKDLRNGEGVSGHDVVGNSLGRRQVNEWRLLGSQIVRVESDQAQDCDLPVGGFVECVGIDLRLPSPGQIVVFATGAFFGDAAAPADKAFCEIQVDGAGDPIGQSPGQLVSDRTDSTATDGFARTVVASQLPRGLHRVALSCDEIEGEATIGTPTITAFALTGR